MGILLLALMPVNLTGWRTDFQLFQIPGELAWNLPAIVTLWWPQARCIPVFFGNVAALLQFAWKWVLLSGGRVVAVSQGWDSPRGDVGWIKRVVSASCRCLSMLTEFHRMLSPPSRGCSLSVSPQTSGMSNPRVEGTGGQHCPVPHLDGTLLGGLSGSNTWIPVCPGWNIVSWMEDHLPAGKSPPGWKITSLLLPPFCTGPSSDLSPCRSLGHLCGLKSKIWSRGKSPMESSGTPWKALGQHRPRSMCCAWEKSRMLMEWEGHCTDSRSLLRIFPFSGR